MAEEMVLKTTYQACQWVEGPARKCRFVGRDDPVFVCFPEKSNSSSGVCDEDDVEGISFCDIAEGATGASTFHCGAESNSENAARARLQRVIMGLQHDGVKQIPLGEPTIATTTSYQIREPVARLEKICRFVGHEGDFVCR